MTIINRQGMIDRFGELELTQLTDRATPLSGAIVDAVLDRALADADAKIISYIQTRYDVNLVASSPALVKVAGDLARFYLHDDGATEQVQKNHNDAVTFLRDLAAGKAALDLADAPIVNGDAVQHAAPDRVFSRETLGGF